MDSLSWEEQCRISLVVASCLAAFLGTPRDEIINNSTPPLIVPIITTVYYETIHKHS